MSETETSPEDGGAAAAPRRPGGRRRLSWLGGLVFLVAALVYGLTANRAVPFWDAGEFIATSWILGIPHQPSTPLYVLLGRLAALVPLGAAPAAIAFRVNLLSALAAAVAALFVYLAVRRLAWRLVPGSRLAVETAGVVGALGCAFASTNWANAVEAEVYALSSAVMAFCIWAVVRWRDRGLPDDRILLVVCYVLSLAIGIHLGTDLVLPGLVLLVVLASPRSFVDLKVLAGWTVIAVLLFLIGKYAGLGTVGLRLAWLAALAGAAALSYRWLNRRFLLAAGLLFLLGVSVHLFLLIRAGLDPPINEADPSTWSALMDTLQRKQYPIADIFVRRAAFWSVQMGHMFFRYLREQWVLFPGLAGLGGLLPLAAALAGGAAQARRDRHGFAMMLVLVLCTGPLLVVYLNFTDHEVRERDYFFAACFQMLAMWLGLAAGALVGRWRRRPRLAAAAAAAAVALALAPLASGWHMHDRSRDVIARDYAHNMLEPLPSDAILFTNGDNDTFPLWYAQQVEGCRTDVAVVNLSLLNTTWYIRQLRDGKPAYGIAPVPIRLSDAQIDGLLPRLDRSGGILFRKDLAVRQILADNAWRRPVYLAVTVPDRMGLEPRLTMECLSHRVAPDSTAERINVAACRRCVDELFPPLTGILDEQGATDTTLYKTPNEHRLVQNYAAIHFYLAVEYDRRGRTEEALAEALRAEAISPGFSGNRHFMGLLYEALGQTQKAEDHYRHALATYGEDFRTLHALGELLAREGRIEEGLPVLERAVELAAGAGAYFQPSYTLFSVYAALGQRQRALAVLDGWLALHPGDVSIRDLRQRFLRDAAAEEEEGEGAAAGGAGARRAP